MSPEKPQKGDKVSWSWGGGAPGGTVAETKDEGEIAIKSKRGNTIKKNASPDNPAVHIERSGNDVVKRASELTVEKKGSKNKNKGGNGSSSSKRKAGSQEHENERDEASDSEDPHTTNKQGKEVKKGGKDASKKQKIRQTTEVEDKTSGSETTEKEEDEEDGEQESEDEEPKKSITTKKNGNTKRPRADKKGGESKSSGRTKTKAKDPVPRTDDDLVSTRTRSHDKAT
ncbi:hypothetical protein F4825DRAFT_454418 [Nemania diffusa]|nr:hypothetical protein F4825DRAFT_454418 [Nemania diffusa]